MLIIKPWHWAVLGLVLLIAEIFLPTFFVLWFGVGALITAIVFWLFGIGIYAQVILWLLVSSAFALLWFKYLNPKRHKTSAGLGGASVVGQTGLVIFAYDGVHDGRVRFVVPVLGSSEWAFKSDAPIEVGARIVISDVLGNTLFCQRF